ncbi:hypothetical protein ACQW02_19780 [Humitalea sp. 24SJ18S-53]|uniref:hypothetical protein n=1 Tax=Humitalea sp. 24SJ18S-53 TaxID=3422307 RepID=UPI003D67277E
MSDELTRHQREIIGARLLVLAGGFYSSRETGGNFSAADAMNVFQELEACAFAVLPNEIPRPPLAPWRFVHPGGRA